MKFQERREKLVDYLISSRYLKNRKVIDAIKVVPRHEFVPKSEEKYAYEDRPLGIPKGQTISAPHMVAIMTEILDIQNDDKILEIGTGSGYQAAVLGEIAKKGKIYSIERITELASFAKKNLKKCGYDNVQVISCDGTMGLSKKSPYDKIIVTAGAPYVPKALIEQLKTSDSRLLIPIGDHYFQNLTLIVRDCDSIKEKKFCSCVFVDLIGKDGWK